MPRTYGSTTERGYGVQHQRKRADWKPMVDRGEVECHAVVCLEELDGYGRWIRPGARWHLGHTTDHTAWTGPEHERCNTHEGAVRGNQQRGSNVRTPPEPATRTANRWAL